MSSIRPRFSVVIPCYNEERFITKTLLSLKHQTFSGNYEIIVVDNNCSDETVNIARKFSAVIVTENNPGVCWARQAGTEMAKGEIIVSTDADTVHSSDWLESIDQSFKRHSDCVAVAGPCTYLDGPWWGKKYTKLLFGSVSIVDKLIGFPFYVTATNIAFKKSAWTGYHTSMTQGGDELALLHDLKSEGKVVFNNSNPVFTSGRRLNKGLLYNIFVSFLLYYLMAYYVNKLFKRRVIGTAPAYRTFKPANKYRVLAYESAIAAIALIFIHLPGHDTLLQQAFETLKKVNFF